MQTAMVTCDVCRLLDGDLRPKPCTWCSRCNAWICDGDRDNWIRRSRAAAIRARLIARTVAVVALAIAAVLSFARPAAAQGPAYPYTVPNTWTLSTTAPALVAGQKVYRAPFASTCGTWTLLTSTLLSNSATNYTDNVSPAGDGATLCYAVSAVGTNGKESAFDVFDPVPVPPAPPTGLAATVAKNANGSYDVIYAWKNPTPAPIDNTIYCGPTKASAPIVKTFFPTTKVRITSPAGTNVCGVTDTGQTGESGLSNLAKVTVP